MSSVLARAVVVLEGDADALNKMLSAAEQRMIKAGERMQDVGKTLTTRVTLPIVALGALAVKSFGEQEDAIARTNAVLNASGNAAGITAGHLQELAETLQRTTRFSDDTAQSAMAVLLTFQSVRNQGDGVNAVFDRTALVAADLAALLGTDLQSAMLQVGKAMEDPETGLTMLRRAGVVFSDQVMQQIKELHEQGRTFEAQKIILAGLESRLGGVAAAMAETPIGQFKQAWNAVSDALEDVGKVIAEVLVPLSRWVKRAAESFKGWSDEAKRAVVIIGAIVAAVGPALVVIGTLIKVGTLVGAVLGGLVIPIALAVAAIGALVAAGLAVAQHWLWLKQQVVSLWAFIKNAFFTGIDAVLSIVEKIPFIIAPGLAKAATLLRTELAEAAEESMARSGAALSEIEAQMDAAADEAVKAGKQMQAALNPPKPPAPPPGWLKAAQEAVKEFSGQLRQAADMEKLLGDSFDLTAERAKAYEQVVSKLVEAGVDFDAKVGPNGETLRELANRMLDLRLETERAERAQEAFDEQMSLATQAVEAAMTPTEVFEKTLSALQEAVALGKITWEQYTAAVKKAEETMRDATSTSAQLKEAIQDIAGRAVDDFVDFAFGAKKSFSDFVRQALIDLTKLILKIELMKLLFPEGGGGILGFQHGGFLRPGEMGLVGEAGPELIAGGRNGITVTPMPAMNAEAAMPGSNITVNVNVAAVDSRDAARFFEENEGLVANAMMRAQQRSRALQQQLGGR